MAWANGRTIAFWTAKCWWERSTILFFFPSLRLNLLHLQYVERNINLTQCLMTMNCSWWGIFNLSSSSQTSSLSSPQQPSCLFAHATRVLRHRTYRLFKQPAAQNKSNHPRTWMQPARHETQDSSKCATGWMAACCCLWGARPRKSLACFRSLPPKTCRAGNPRLETR